MQITGKEIKTHISFWYIIWAFTRLCYLIINLMSLSLELLAIEGLQKRSSHSILFHTHWRDHQTAKTSVKSMVTQATLEVKQNKGTWVSSLLLISVLGTESYSGIYRRRKINSSLAANQLSTMVLLQQLYKRHNNSQPFSLGI